MQEYCSCDRQSGDAKVAGFSRSPLLRRLKRKDFLSQEKSPRASDAFASDRACSGAKAKNQRRRLDEERNAVFNQSADLSTYPRKISVRTPQATAFGAAPRNASQSKYRLMIPTWNKTLPSESRLTSIRSHSRNAVVVRGLGIDVQSTTVAWKCFNTLT